MKVTCLNCGLIQKPKKIFKDKIGKHCNCIVCDSSFNIK